MTQSTTFAIDNAWRLLLKDLGIQAERLLRRAELPGDLFAQEGMRLPWQDYFRLWRCLEEEANDPLFALRVGEALSVEHFNPPIFAALCSPHFNQAVRRLGQFKKLIGPMYLELEEESEMSTIFIGMLPLPAEPPALMMAVELIFLLQLVRFATREPIRPLELVSTCPFVPKDAYTAFFGVEPKCGDRHFLRFSAQDAQRPFLTSNEQMWTFFEPGLRKHLSSLSSDATTLERVHSALLELLPGGQSSIQDVARVLHMSTRTLQRRLQAEGTNFQAVLGQSRERLARHYLRSSTLSAAEISLLLGFDEPTSFFRAFQAWTGETPERVRASSQMLS